MARFEADYLNRSVVAGMVDRGAGNIPTLAKGFPNIPKDGDYVFGWRDGEHGRNKHAAAAGRCAFALATAAAAIAAINRS